MNASLPQQTRDNGSLYAHIFIYPAGGSPFGGQLASHAISLMTVYSLPQDESINLLSSDKKLKEVSQNSRCSLFFICSILHSTLLYAI